MRYTKYHALGNSYIVLDPKDGWGTPTKAQITSFCRPGGIGSDGILFGPLSIDVDTFWLRIFNPDGSEAEKSGNGIRIFARYLSDSGHTNAETFRIATSAGEAKATLLSSELIEVEMGKVVFHESGAILKAHDQDFSYTHLSVGNPHCVIEHNDPTEDLAKTYGPIIEHLPIFENRTNVQFVNVLDSNNIRIEIWERGAGYTTASGTSSIAAAATVRKLGKCGDEITVHMPGGTLLVRLTNDFEATLTGPVTFMRAGDVR